MQLSPPACCWWPSSWSAQALQARNAEPSLKSFLLEHTAGQHPEQEYLELGSESRRTWVSTERVWPRVVPSWLSWAVHKPPPFPPALLPGSGSPGQVWGPCGCPRGPKELSAPCADGWPAALPRACHTQAFPCAGESLAQPPATPAGRLPGGLLCNSAGAVL